MDNKETKKFGKKAQDKAQPKAKAGLRVRTDARSGEEGCRWVPIDIYGSGCIWCPSGKYYC